MAYSHFFQVLHDERTPVSLGRGTHYSVVRTIIPVLEKSDPTSPAEQMFGGARRRRLELFDLAIIWDEDHDERIFSIIERLHAAGLLAPVRFIGERKGGVTVICDPKTDYGDDDYGGYDRYCQLVEKHTLTDDGDEWNVEVMQGIGDGSGQIINDSKARVDAYLRGIEASWDLGPSAWKFRRKTA
jgi:hypothetical protein